MIETEQSVSVERGIDQVWSFAHDFERWAEIMPGFQRCDIVDADNSSWVLKIGVGGLVRTVTVKVQVTEWAGPERVDFTYTLDGDPVEGSGTYRAVASSAAQTELTLHVRVAGSGPLAPMWEALCRPVLPKFALAFARQLKGRIEQGFPTEA